jgi:glycosyltransferase involved in cell wall biosynthesis
LSITSRHRPAVSVVIPCFNAERLVGDAIRSALAQTYPETEIIVIDDGSTDGSRGVIESFADRVRWVVQPHRGGGAARNRGLELARGEFVQFLDADDVLDAECLARKVAMQQEHPDVCMCCDWRRIDLSGQVAREEPGVDGDSVEASLTERIQTASPLHRASDLQRVGGFDASLPCCQETDLHLRLACQGVRFRRLPEALLTVRRQPGSVSSDYTKLLLQHEVIFIRAAENLRARDELTPARRFAFARQLAADGRLLFRRSMRAAARRCWHAAATLDRAGLRSAYGRWTSRPLLTLLGPELTEQVMAALASVRGRS